MTADDTTERRVHPTGDTTERRARPNDGTEPVDYETVRVDALVIGAGAAGARAAIELVETGVDPEDVLVVGKRAHGDAHTTWARGGVNGALGTRDPEDSPAIHAADTLTEGHFLSDPAKVERVATEMPARLRELDQWGMPFSRTADGEIDQRYFGAQSFRRTAFAGDHTGESLLETLVDRARTLAVPYRDGVTITTVLVDDDRVYGAAGYDAETGAFLLFEARSVILAAGGYTGLYARNTSRADENTGDGPALALAAGATLSDVEFVQFHPTGMAVDESDPDWAPWAGRLVTEAVRGEGGRLLNADGERFMEHYSPEQMELDARDVVARAIATEIREGRGTANGGVFLDVSHRDPAYVRERLPRMTERYAALGVDFTREAVEVAPTAHYGMGGVVVDDDGETHVDGLYAVGETMAGVHGANRLGGNSLAETLVFGRVAGAAVAARLLGDGTATPPGGADGSGDGAREAALARVHDRAASHFAALTTLTDRDGSEDPATVLADLRAVLWTHAGILRDERRLSEGLDALAGLRERSRDLATGPRATGPLSAGRQSEAATTHADHGEADDTVDRRFETAVALGFALSVAEVLFRAALARTESRGAHHRTDHPTTEDDQRLNRHWRRDATGEFRVSTHVPAEPSAAVQAALDAGYELDYHQLE